MRYELPYAHKKLYGRSVLGVNTLHRLFCFFKLFPMVGKGLIGPANPPHLHVPQCIRLLITPSILLKLQEVWDRQPHNPDHIMVRAACTTWVFFGFLRSGEITTPPDQFVPGAHLAFGDIRLDSPSNSTLAQVNIKTLKMEPFRGVSRPYRQPTLPSLHPGSLGSPEAPSTPTLIP